MLFELLLAVIAGIVVGITIMTIASKSGLNRAKSEAETILDESKAKADNIIAQANLEGQQKILDMQAKTEKELKVETNKLTQKENQLSQRENQLSRREDNLDRKENSLNSREDNLISKEKKLEDKNRSVDEKLANISKMEKDLQDKINEQIVVLEKAANMTQEDARKVLMDAVEKKSEKEIAVYLHEQDEIAQEKASDNARNIIANAIQRYSQEEVIERTVSVVTLPNEDMKGRIIGREGRNIKAIEQATGVDLIIDDTPDAITVSCFDPIRKEIAKQSLEALMKDGRIQPGRIEEVVEKVRKNMDETMQKAGDEAVFNLGINRMPRELVKLLGRLRYRYSYGQNVLQHSIEVATFAGIMAADLGLNQQLAKRAGLLHDIGKAVDFEQDGSHVELGAKIAKKFGENEIVVNAIESHHGDKPAEDIIAVLVAAADTLSAARPGARYESMENYIERLEQLENIAQSFDGVEKAYAIQAGREVRVMISPEKVNDEKMYKIAHDIKDRIENEMKYPGQIKVTLIREVRVQELAQ